MGHLCHIPSTKSSECKTIRAKVVDDYSDKEFSRQQGSHTHKLTISITHAHAVNTKWILWVLKKKYMILKVNRVGVVKGGIRGQDMGVDVIKLYCMHV